MDIRRKTIRFAQPADAFIAVTGAAHTTVTAVVFDLSESGMRFMCQHELKKNKDYTVKIIVPISGATVSVIATIVRKTFDETFGSFEYGSSFAHMSTNDTANLLGILSSPT